MTCKKIFSSELPDILEKSRQGKKVNSKAIAKPNALQANAKKLNGFYRTQGTKYSNIKFSTFFIFN